MTTAEVITACENVCQDFSWIGPVTDWLADLAVVIGVLLGFFQLRTWRQEHLGKRRAEISENLLSTTYEVVAAISLVRSTFESLPVNVSDVENEILLMKSERLADFDSKFSSLRNAQVLHQAYTGNQEVLSAVERLFDVRQRIRSALIVLRNSKLRSRMSVDEVAKYEEQRRVLFNFSDRDEIAQEIEATLSSLKQVLLPEIRMERK